MTRETPSTEVLSTDVLIIGGGPAGIQAARLLKLERPAWEVTVLRPEPHSLVYCALPYAMEGLFPLEQTFKKDDLVTAVGAKLIQTRAIALDPAARKVTLADHRQVSYGKLLIATGAVPIRPPVPGVDLGNVFTVKTADDAVRIMALLAAADPSSTPPPRAVVIGSGAIGIEQATAYRARGFEVHLVEMLDRLLPHLLDQDMTIRLQEELLARGIRLHLSTRLEGLTGATKVEQVRLSGGATIDLVPERDFVVLAVGMRPDIGFLASSGLATTPDGLEVDAQMRTSIQDIWAAGDCTAFHSGIDGKPLGGKLATNAVPMAKVAARDMLGLPAAYKGFFNGAASVVGEVRVAGTGFTETYARHRGLDVFATRGATPTRFPMMPGVGQVEIKMIWEKRSGRLIGAQALGDEAIAERIDVCTLALQQGATAADLAELSYAAQPWQTFFPARNAIVEAATAARDLLEKESTSAEVGGK